MSKYIILPDVTCDLSKEMRDYFGLEDYLMGYVTINGKEMNTRLDWENISRDNFYKTLSNKKNQVSSAAPTPEEYYQSFKKYVDNGYSGMLDSRPGLNRLMVDILTNTSSIPNILSA